MSHSGYGQSAQYYDLVYQSGMGKDYAAEAKCLAETFAWKRLCSSRRLLDMGCGTGAHATHYAKLGWEVDGVDISPQMLTVARQRCPTVTFYEGDMANLQLDGRWGVITSEFGAVAHLLTYEQLCAFCVWCWDHLEPGGILAYEPWIRPGRHRLGKSAVRRVSLPGLEVVREGYHRREGDIALIDQYFTVIRPGHVEQFREELRLALFTTSKYENAMRAAGFAVSTCYVYPTLCGTIFGRKL